MPPHPVLFSILPACKAIGIQGGGKGEGVRLIGGGGGKGRKERKKIPPFNQILSPGSQSKEEEGRSGGFVSLAIVPTGTAIKTKKGKKERGGGGGEKKGEHVL